MKTRSIIANAILLAIAVVGANAQSVVEVGGAGTIGDSALPVTGGTARIPDPGGKWSANGGTGVVYSNLETPQVTVASAGPVTLRFNHRYNFEAGWDAGTVYVSINGGAFNHLPASAFSANGYFGPLEESLVFTGGVPVFTGQSTGFPVAATVESVADLGTLSAGATLVVRFRGGWDDVNVAPGPNWEITTVKLTDSANVDLLAATFVSDGSARFTATSDPGLVGPWTYAPVPTTRFEIDATALTADRYVPSSAPAVIDLSGAKIQVVLLAGTLDAGETFTLFDLTGGSSLTGTPASILLPPLGVWNTGNLTTNGTITFVSPPPTLTWNLTGPGNGVWDLGTPNWTEGVGTTTYVPGAITIFDKPDGGVISVVDMSPGTLTVQSAGNYTFTPAVTPGVPSILGGTLTKSGSGILQLGDSAWNGTANAGTYANGFTAVNINAGSVYYGSRNAFGSGTVTLADGTALRKRGQEGNGATLTMANPIVLNGEVNLHIQFSDFKDQWFSGQISGPGSIRVTGERRALTLTGDNTFSGGVTMENYTGTGATSLYNLDLGHPNALGTGTLTVKTALLPALVQVRGLGANVAMTEGTGVPNDVVIQSGAMFYVGRGQNMRFGGDISGAGGLRKRNTNTVILDGANTYTGGTTVEAGTLTLNGSLADSTLSILGGAATGGTVNGSGTLTFNIDGTTSDQISVTGGAVPGNLVATELDLAVNATGAGLTENEYVLVDASAGGTITDPFVGITGAPGYLLNYATPGQVKLVKIGSATPFQTWAGSATFISDKNGDGMANGIAFLLGAATPDANGLGLLPSATRSGTGLELSFTMLNSASRGDSKLHVQWSGDLGVADLWAGNSTLVPDVSGTVNGVVFQITPGTPLNTVQATIPLSEAVGGKLFGRLSGTEN